MTQNFAEKFIIYWRKKIKLNFTQYPDHIFMEKSKNNIANIFPVFHGVTSYFSPMLLNEQCATSCNAECTFKNTDSRQNASRYVECVNSFEIFAEILLAHLSRRLIGELIVYRSSRRLCVCACVR